MSFPDPLATRIRNGRIVATVSLSAPEEALHVIEAILEGGINVIELTLRHESALESLRRICVAFGDEVLVGAGTVLTWEQLHQVADAGARFAVAPGCHPQVIEAAAEMAFPFAPGIATPSEIEVALSLGCQWLKYFPAEALGGLSYLKAMSAPYAHRGIQWIPLGGINESNFADYLAHPAVGAVGGSWLVSAEDVADRRWDAITRRCRAASGAAEKLTLSAT